MDRGEELSAAAAAFLLRPSGCCVSIKGEMIFVISPTTTEQTGSPSSPFAIICGQGKLSGEYLSFKAKTFTSP